MLNSTLGIVDEHFVLLNVICDTNNGAI